MNRRCFLMALAAGYFLPHLTGFANDNSSPKNEKRIHYIEIHLANYCNLNCKYCDHFSNIADKTLYDLESFKKDLKQIAKVTQKKINCINLLGGEPLLNPDIIKYFEAVREYLDFSTGIQLTTNGILLDSMKPEFWKALNEHNILLNPSFYNINIDWKTIYKKIKKYKIRTNYKKFLKEANNNKIEHFFKFKFDLNGTQEDLLKCQSCRNFCHNLFEGKLYICPTMAYVKYFNKKFNQNIKVVEGDYLDIYKIKNIDEIIEWEKSPKQFCKYCQFDGLRPWEASQEHDISEWT